jgi:type II secretory pathway predicted ATPase ExeA
MYEPFFRLKSKPFTILPDPSIIYWGRPHSLAYAMLEFGVMNGAGFTVITGEIGAGKTTLIRHLLKSLPATVTPALISNSPQDRQELLQWILMALNQPFEGGYLALFKRLNDYLLEQFANGQRTMLIIDEAQNLAPEALEHLRMISNINADSHQILQIILVGQPQLRDMLVKPELHQLVQRVSSDFHIRPLTAPEVAEFIEFRIQAVSAVPRSEPLFSPEACDKIAQASGGIPRLINILCDTALVYSFSMGDHHVSGVTVDQVIEDKKKNSIFPVQSGAGVPAGIEQAGQASMGAEEELVRQTGIVPRQVLQ